VVIEVCQRTDKQADRHTDTKIAILRTHSGVGRTAAYPKGYEGIYTTTIAVYCTSNGQDSTRDKFPTG